MRSCAEYEALVSAFLDGEVTEAERSALAEHLTGCPACQRYFDDLVAIHDAFDQEEAGVPPDFTAAVMERVRAVPQEREEKVLPFPRWRRWAALAACCAIAAAGLWSLGLRGGDTKAARSVLAGDAPAAQAVMPDAPEEPAVEESEPMPEDADIAPALCMEEDGAQLEPPAERATVYDESPVLTVAAPEADRSEEKASSLACTLVAGGETARRWVEEELGLPWEAGRSYPLTEEAYAGLLAALTEAGEDFRQEPGELCLRAEEVPAG